jgi:cytochrome P450
VDNPKLIPNAVEEMLRFDPAVIQFRRTATEDIEMGGQLIKKGDKVVMYYHSANRDESLFSNPDEFNILRDNAKEHRAFGIGEHYCLGAHLARLELNVMFNEIVPKLRNPRIVGNVDRLRSNFINGTKVMNIEFDAA